MKREDFKEIKEEHFEVCNKIILSEGVCGNRDCKKCPFFLQNATNEIDCTHYSNTMFCGVKDEKLVESAKEFLKFNDEETK